MLQSAMIRQTTYERELRKAMLTACSLIQNDKPFAALRTLHAAFQDHERRKRKERDAEKAGHSAEEHIA